MNKHKNVLKAAREYLKQGFAVIPVPRKKKRPVLKDWPNLRLTEADLPEHFAGKSQNISLLLGEASNGLVDVDLDCPEAIALASYFLPPTSVFGRPSKRGSHWLYKASPLPTSKRYTYSALNEQRNDNDIR